MSRLPSCAGLAPTSAWASYFISVPLPSSKSRTVAPPLAWPARPPLPSPERRYPLGGVDIRQLDPSCERRMDRPNSHRYFGGHLRVEELFQRFTAGNALLEHVGVVERGPQGLPACRNPTFACHVHLPVPFARMAIWGK